MTERVFYSLFNLKWKVHCLFQLYRITSSICKGLWNYHCDRISSWSWNAICPFSFVNLCRPFLFFDKLLGPFLHAHEVRCLIVQPFSESALRFFSNMFSFFYFQGCHNNATFLVFFLANEWFIIYLEHLFIDGFNLNSLLNVLEVWPLHG